MKNKCIFQNLLLMTNRSKMTNIIYNLRRNKTFKYYRYLSLTLIILPFIIQNTYAGLPIKSFFSEPEINIVLKGGIITKAYLKSKDTVHTPNSDKSINLPGTKYTDKGLSGYEMICIEKAFLPCKNLKEIRQIFYAGLNNAAKLTEVMYYSRTDKEFRQLITESRSISLSGEDRHANDATMQPASVNYFRIADNRFGSLEFKGELFDEGNAYILKNTCVQPMKKYLALINKKYEYRLISFFIYDNNAGGYFLYSVNAMRIRSSMILNLGLLRPESFGNRIRAYTVYFAGLLGLNWKDRLIAFE